MKITKKRFGRKRTTTTTISDLGRGTPDSRARGTRDNVRGTHGTSRDGQ